MDPISAMITGGFNMIGQERANQANANLSREADARSLASAREQMTWQEHMSNTSHQRAKKDLEAAGLNPMLAAQTGASTPSGASYSGTAGKVENSLSGAMASAQEAIRMSNDLKMQGAQIKAIDQGIKLTNAQTNEANMRTTVMSKDIPKAEMINEAYKAGKQIINKIKGSQIFSPKFDSTNLNNYREGMLKMKGKP